MRHIKKPEFDQREVFLACTSTLKDKKYKCRIEAFVDDIVQGSYDYEDKKANNQIHTISKQSVISSDDMIKLYKQKFVGKISSDSGNISSGRMYYDSLRSSAPGGICPLCGQRTVSTLDHYLPKSIYPLYSVTIVNLIPVCMDCNKVRGASEILKEEDAIIHPYFDISIDEQLWLDCKFDEKHGGLIFLFDVVKPYVWDDLLYKRMKNHFDSLKLSELYSIHAAAEFENDRYFLEKRLNKGISEVKVYIEDKIESYSRVANNSWQVSMYRALLSDFKKFCEFLSKEYTDIDFKKMKGI